MARYVIKRFIISLIVLFAVLFLTYTIVYNLPSNYAEIVAREMSMSGSNRSAEEWEKILLSEYGLDSGLLNGFFTWLSNSLVGNFGTSWYYGVDVTEKFYPSFSNSAVIGLVATVITLFIAIPLGIYTVSCRNKRIQKIISIFAVIFVSMPVFFIVALLKYVFAIELGWFDLGGLKSFDSIDLSPGEAFADKISHLVLPVLAMVISSAGTLIKYVNVNVKSIIGSRYVKALRAKGLSDKEIVTDHLMRNAAVPVINIVCTIFPTVLSGSIVIETLFSIDGIGYVAYNALMNGDIPMIMFYIFHTALITIGFSFISDVLCALADYRVCESLTGRK